MHSGFFCDWLQLAIWITNVLFIDLCFLIIGSLFETGFFPPHCFGKFQERNSPKKLRLLCNLIFSFVLKTMQASLDPKIKTPWFLKEFLSSGNWTRTNDLRVMSPTSYLLQTVEYHTTIFLFFKTDSNNWQYELF